MPRKLVIDIKPPRDKSPHLPAGYSGRWGDKPRLEPAKLSELESVKFTPLNSENPGFQDGNLTGFAVPKTNLITGLKLWLKIFFALAAVTLGAVIALTLIGYQNLKKTFISQAPELYSNFEEAGAALINLETGKAKDSLLKINTSLSEFENQTRSSGFLKLAELWSSAIPKFKAIPETFKKLGILLKSSLALAAGLETIKNESFGWLINQKGELLIQTLSELRNNLDQISFLSSAFETDLKKMPSGLFPNKNLLSFAYDLEDKKRFLSALENWLRRPETKHLLVLFQNPAELRPAGGFLGSYAELQLNPNGLQDIKVWDVYDPDGQLDINIVPPRELQATTPRWGARDANWFFDFPASANKVISILELSKIYSEKRISFDGALAINLRVLQSILEVIGPIELPEYRLTITALNLPTELQREVEAGKDKKAGEPKRILKVLTPIIFEKLGRLENARKETLFKTLKDHILKKDIMFYFQDWEIQGYFKDLGVSGAVAELPEKFDGDYLAVVNANIAGGKSDAFINQKIKLSTKIGADGGIDNYLTIEKTHTGQDQKDFWFKTPNKAYLKIFTPKGSELTYLTGGETRKIQPLVDYQNSNYLIDPLLQSIETTNLASKNWKAEQLLESGKTVFATWLTVNPGKTQKLELEYLNPAKLNLNSDSIPYQFIFEKQSGAAVSLDLLFETPIGFRWLENGEKAINFLDEDPPGRLSINLTLVPDHEAERR